MRIVFMGTPDFAVGTLKALIASEHEVAAVVTQPDKPKGRGKSVQFTPVKETALSAGIPVYQPERVKEETFLLALREIGPEAIVVVAFGQIIPEAILKLPKYGCINVHASLLPKYRGAAPIQWAVIDGEEVSGVTTMQMDAGLDTGDMLMKREVKLAPDETGGSLFEKLSAVGAELLIETLKGLEEGNLLPTPQPKESPTPYAAMLTKQMGVIDWQKSAPEIERLIRGLNPWPSAYTRLEGKTLKIWKARACGGDGKAESMVCGGGGNAEPEACGGGVKSSAMACGKVVCVTKKEIGVQTGNGVLMLEEVQLEGKKRMTADAFLRGFALHEGEVLG
ncbi:MAG: methionyl-tRNA formyltransferase [Eubacteriales bacterium]|nr:methionyl-tRNA formyltransferase [Eubacteriales bacterium]